MYFGLSEEQSFFQENVRKYLEEHATINNIKHIIEILISCIGCRITDPQLYCMKTCQIALVKNNLNNLCYPAIGGSALPALSATSSNYD